MKYLPLEFNKLSLEIENRQVLDDICFSIHSPGVYAIIGHNGSGKTLLLNTIAGLIKPSSGTVTWRETPIAPALTWLPTQPVLLKRSVLSNITSILVDTKKQRHQRAMDALKWASIDHLAQRLATELSTGEQQQVAIARAKAVNADIVLIDELYANLDSQAAMRVETLVKQLKACNKLLIITGHHRSQLTSLADCVITLENAKLSAQT